jgi:hypothetical protein
MATPEITMPTISLSQPVALTTVLTALSITTIPEATVSSNLMLSDGVLFTFTHNN